MTDSKEDEESIESVRQFCANGGCMRTDKVESKLDAGDIQEAESSLRHGLSLNFEEARALLGKLEYQRGNLEGVLRVFDGIDLQASIQKLQPGLSVSEKPSSKKSRSRSDPHLAVSQQAASVMLEAMYLKAKTFQKLGRIMEAANECKSVLDSVENVFHHSLSDVQGDNRLQETVSQAVELLPELWKQVSCSREILSSYRRTLLSQWNLDNDCCARIQKGFVVFLLYSGVEANPPSSASHIEGSYIPKNNLEEAILLLMILMRKYHLGKTKWDPSIMEHLTFALSICCQTCVLAKQFEEMMPGIFLRIERWKNLALCYSGAGQSKTALNLLRKSLNKHEQPDDLISLLLAAKSCNEDYDLAVEGIEYAERAISNSQEKSEYLKGVGLRMHGLCLGKQAKASPSDFERTRLQSEALKSLEGALSFEQRNPDLLFDLGIQYAEQRNLNAALRYTKKFIEATGGAILNGWRLLALILSAQQRYSEAAVVTDAALDETTKWEQGPILRLKAKLKISQSLPMDAIETYRYLLALIQAQRKSLGPLKSNSLDNDDKANEYEVWQGLANLYSSLSHWKDVEICLGKAGELKKYTAEMLYTEGVMCEERGQIQGALSAHMNALLLEPSYAPCKIRLGGILCKMGTNVLPVARSLLSDALRIEPTNRTAWYYLGVVHRDDGRIADAADCFQAASMLEESNPIESFNSLL